MDAGAVNQVVLDGVQEIVDFMLVVAPLADQGFREHGVVHFGSGQVVLAGECLRDPSYELVDLAFGVTALADGRGTEFNACDAFSGERHESLSRLARIANSTFLNSR